MPSNHDTVLDERAAGISDVGSDAPRRPRVWGLHAPALHDAFWRANGVQCVRRGQPEPIQPGTDLFLLIEPDQLVLFDLPSMVDELAWRKASLTRLRVTAMEGAAYAEHVELDERGCVTRIGRRYRPRRRAAYRVVLTRNLRYARLWMDARARHEGWREVHRSAGWSNVDTLRCPGECFMAGDSGEESRLIQQLVEAWVTPGRALGGISEVRDGVWMLETQSLPDDFVAIGPAWVGLTNAESLGPCVIGPTCVPDVSAPNGDGAVLHEITRIGPDVENLVAPIVARPRDIRIPHTFAKRTLDILVSGTGFLLLLPIFLILAVIILCDDGRPIFFGHLRQARGGRLFRCWKFRTMVRDADAVKQRLEEKNICDGRHFYIANDPRVTRAGRLLRRYHLDELPQLWNVLVGEMSLVGPRPSPDDENQLCAAWREKRLSVRPGITGLWQLNRTREPGTDLQEWIRWDLEYVQTASFRLDVTIILLTIRRIFSGIR